MMHALAPLVHLRHILGMNRSQNRRTAGCSKSSLEHPGDTAPGCYGNQDKIVRECGGLRRYPHTVSLTLGIAQMRCVCALPKSCLLSRQDITAAASGPTLLSERDEPLLRELCNLKE